MQRRGTSDPTGLGYFHDWAWSWPLNRRVMYNRASADANGQPWDPTRPGIRWNGTAWVGDVPDFPTTSPPSEGTGSFIMTGEGVGRLFAPGTLTNDGPFPEHYEPMESPVHNALSKQQNDPAVFLYKDAKDTFAAVDSEFPYVATTYRVTEHEHYVTQNVPYLVEAMPDFFVELPVELAEKKGISNGGKVKVRSKRGEVIGIALVTKRMRPLKVAGKEWNSLPPDNTANFGGYQSHPDLTASTWDLMRFKEIELDGGDLAWLIRKDSCLHCDDPGCLAACPAPGAIVQYTNGIVNFDQTKCIGCQYCVAGCPFDIPRFDQKTKKVYKCTLCVDRVSASLEPACVKSCPTGAIKFGGKNEMLDYAAGKVDKIKGRGFDHAMVYDPSGVGGLHMMYVVPRGDKLSDYGLPEDPQVPGSFFSALSVLRKLGSISVWG